MQKKPRNFLAIIGIVPIAIISFIIIANEMKIERCYGLVDAILGVFLNGVLILTLTISGIIQVVKITNEKESILIRALNLLIIILFSGIAFWFTKQNNDYFQEPVILKAEFIENLDIGKITLREKMNFSVQYGHIDWSCVKVGEYEIKNDTLILGDRIFNESNKIIAAKYLIQNNEYLLPIESNNQFQDTTRWMKINVIKKENWR